MSLVSLAWLKSKAAEDSEKYFELVWIARKNIDAVLSDSDHPSRPGVEKIMKKHPLELEKLQSQSGDWQHGFNSGLLAASRMYMDLSIAYEEDMAEDLDELEDMYEGTSVPPVSERLAASRKDAVDEFPMLDS